LTAGHSEPLNNVSLGGFSVNGKKRPAAGETPKLTVSDLEAREDIFRVAKV
jgi:hypothetical protein